MVEKQQRFENLVHGVFRRTLTLAEMETKNLKHF